MTILLTGATGQTGRHLVARLAEHHVPFAAMVRDPVKAAWLTDLGAELRPGDLSDQSSVAKALDGIDTALLLAANSEHQLDLERSFVDCAAECGVGRVVKYSAIMAAADAAARIPHWHGQSDRHLQGSGLRWTILRPAFFMQNLLHSSDSVRSEGKIYLPMGQGRLGMVDCRDNAEVLAKVLVEDGHEGQIYTLTGPGVIGFEDAASAIGDAIGKPVEYVAISAQAFKDAAVAHGTPEWLVDAMNEMFVEIAAGVEAVTTDTIPELLGRPARDIVAFAGDHREAFK